MSTEPKRLPYTRPPELDESLRGYLLALAIDNGYQSFKRLLDLCDSYKSKPTTFDTFDLTPLARLTAQPEADLYKLIYRKAPNASRIFQGRTMPDFLISPKRLKFCPTCIEESPELKTSFKAIWDLQLSVVCNKHETYLVPECEKCEKAPSWFSIPWYQCTCGNDLRETPILSADTEILELSRLLIHPLVSKVNSPTCKLPCALGKIKPGDLHWIMAIVGLWANGIVRGQISKRLEDLTSTQRIDVLKKAYWTFSDWPTNFYSFLDQCKGLAGQPSTKSLMNQEFGALYETLMYKIRDPNSEFIRKALKDYGESLSFQEEAQNLDNTSLVNLSKEIGVGISAIRKMFKNGSIKIFKEKRGYKKDRYFISKSDLTWLHAKLADNIILQEVSEILGLKIKSTQRLCDEGVFKTDTENLRDGRSNTMYSKKEVENFLHTLAGKAILKGNLPATKYQKISEAMSIYCINGITRTAFLNSAIKGLLKIYKTIDCPKLENIHIDREEIKEFVLAKINLNKDLISTSKAATELGITEQQIKKLAKNKSIKSTIFTHGARKYRLVSRRSTRVWARKSASKTKP